MDHCSSQLALLFLILLGLLTSTARALVCYSCTATLSSAIDESGQLAMRIFLESTYELPPVHRFCNMEDDIEFRTVPTAQCGNTDQCVKVSAESHGIQFVIRGCQSQIYKPDVGIQQNVQCRAGDSPSLCFCGENLCNGSTKTQIISILFVASAFLALGLR
ncbi:hypothetical protein AAVH_28024 [Aphelenchoides avenae]|nr:hypothetical protein AAVH_28024 [Aphelenchus avenae]